MLERKSSFNPKLDEFEMSFNVYMDYVNRQIKKDINYMPHPFVRALLIAHSEAGNGPNGRYLGVSSLDDSSLGCYSVVLEKRGDKFSILAIQNIDLNLEVPVEVGIYLLILSMRIEKIGGNEILPEDAVDIVNDNIPVLNMILFNNDEWIPARDYCRDVMRRDKRNNEVIEKINSDMTWRDYPSTVRSIIAQYWILEKYPEMLVQDKCNITYTMTEHTIPKKTFLDNILFMLCGEPSKYFDDRFKWTYFSDLVSSDEKINGKIKVGRNHPCKCGSGKKNKYCCNINYL
ncbi:hypothetical protein C7437_101511 [Psychrobacillus insolitus]|uniref:SEC-C motif-containing protein n=1 Tax=Psychrobacillus insolitus TaxID=1461 RepID=A0A2W7MLP7_9BACI|nr:hypothetical protein [Psychrobacillus insolitus]PZX07398.1 hypothetical protein C7437_101511 [Psychrobacillus insolitus]